MIKKTSERSPSPSPSKMRPAPKKPFFGKPAVIVTILALMAVCAVFLWVRQLWTPPAQPLTSDNSPKIKQEVQSTIARVAELVPIKTDERPYVGVITDVDLVKQANPFYKDAEQGDKVLIWSDRAVVYSPSKDKIVAMVVATPANAQPAPAPTIEQPTSTTPVSTALETVTVEIRNASGVAGLAGKLKATLVSDGITVSKIGDAKVKLDNTVIVDLSQGKAPNALAKVSSVSGGTAAALPEGEPTSKADILILIGKAQSVTP
jgi:hypothetical protein